MKPILTSSVLGLDLLLPACGGDPSTGEANADVFPRRWVAGPKQLVIRILREVCTPAAASKPGGTLGLSVYLEVAPQGAR